jgi:hypothetical protein
MRWAGLVAHRMRTERDEGFWYGDLKKSEEDGITMLLKEVWSVGMDWNNLAQGTEQWWALLST